MRSSFLILIALVVALATGAASADKIETVDGDVINGTIVEENDDEIVVESPTVGRVTIPRAQVKPPEPAAEPNPGLFGTPILRGFKRNLSFGASGTQSVIDDAKVNVQLNLERLNERHEQFFRTQYYFSAAQPDAAAPQQTNNNNAAVYYDHNYRFANIPLFLFGSGGYDFDKFQDWTHRIVGNGGLGWRFVDTDRWKIRGRTGPGVSYTFECGPLVTASCFTRPEWLVGLNFRLIFDEDDYMQLLNTYFQDLDDTSIRRYVLSYAWFIGLGYVKGLGLNLGVDFEYDTGRTVPTDLKYFANIAYGF